MSQEIQEIFNGYETLDATTLSSIETNDFFITFYPTPKTEQRRISTLPEVFIEWYLFNSDEPKNIQKFLNDEKLTDIFTESEFMDLICGKAYLDETLIQFVTLKLPFPVSSTKLHNLNKRHHKGNPDTHVITVKHDITKDLRKLYKKQQQKKKEHRKQKDHEYYLKNRKQKIQYSKNWIETHHEQYKTTLTKWRAEHKQSIREINKRYRLSHREQVNKKSNAYYHRHKEKIKQYQQEYHTQITQRKESAKQICAAYLFLLKLRETNLDAYRKLYPGRKNPLTDMFKTCLALQNKDINKCPFCDITSEQNIEQCCNQKVLALPNAVLNLQAIAYDIKTKSR